MRFRISYQKKSSLRFTSALDVQRIWERTCRRASLNIKYSKGFHPQPRIQLGIPLPLGFMSLDEKVDIWIEDSLSLEEISVRFEQKLPVGLEIISIQEIENSAKALSSQIQFSDYRVYLINKKITSQEIKRQISFIRNEKELIRKKRNGKKYNLRPLIQILDLKTDDKDELFIYLRLLSQPNKTGRADEVMFAMGYAIADFLVERIGSYL